MTSAANDCRSTRSETANPGERLVTPAVKNTALKRLFADPQFNVMDGLDVYIDDYTKADPIPPDMLARLQKIMREAEAPRVDLPHVEPTPAGAVICIPERRSAAALVGGAAPVDVRGTAARLLG